MSSAQSLFMVVRRYGPPYDREKPLEAQPEWEAHREAKGVARLGGPLEGGDDVLLIFRARNKDEIERDLAADPWTRSGILTTTRIACWNLRIGEAP
jgi:uncharacterized protein